MPFINSIASLVVDIVTNTAQFNQGLNVVKNDLQNIGNQINLNLTEKTTNLHSTWLRVASQIYSVVHGVRLLAHAFEAVIHHAKEVETAFFNIERVTGNFNDTALRRKVFGEAGAVPLAELQKSLSDTSKLGLSAKAALDAAKVISQLGFVAGDKGEKFNEDFIRVIEVFRLGGTDIERFANVLIQLSRSFQVTEEDLLASTQKFSSFAKMIGLTSAETLAFVAAMRGTGQPGQVATNALTTLFEKLVGDSKKLAEAFRFTAQESEAFSNKLKAHPVAAIRELLEVLSRKSPQEVVEILKDLEISGVRNASAIFALSTNLHILDEAMQNANAGFQNNILLQQQVIAKTETLQGHLNNLSNAWNEFLFAVGTSGIVIEALERITDALKTIDELLGTGRQGIDVSKPAPLLAEINRLKAALDLVIKEQEAEGQLPAATAFAQRLLRGREGDPEYLKKRIAELEDLYNKLIRLKPVVTPTLPHSIDPNLERPERLTKEEQTSAKKLAKAQAELAELTLLDNENLNQKLKKDEADPTRFRRPFADSPLEIGGKLVRNPNAINPLDALTIKKEIKDLTERDKYTPFQGFMSLQGAWKNLLLDKANDPNVKATHEVKDAVKMLHTEVEKLHVDFNKRSFPGVVIKNR